MDILNGILAQFYADVNVSLNKFVQHVIFYFVLPFCCAVRVISVEEAKSNSQAIC